MPTYKASEVVAKWSFKPDKNMPRVVAKACNSISKMYEKMLKDMEKKQKITVKSYEKMLKGMQKKQKDSVKDSKKETNLMLNQYLDMFKKVKDGSKALDLKSMTNPINGAVGIMSRLTGMLKEMQERTKNIVAEASSHEFYASRLGVSSSSLQAFERLGLDYKIEKGEIRGVLEGVQSSIMKMRRGEGDEMTSLLSMMGVSSEDNSADAFNKVLGAIASQDTRQQEILLNKLGINDQAIRPFIELLASYKDNNNPTEKYREIAFEDTVTKSAYQADLDVKDAEAKSSKKFLSEEKIEVYKDTTNNAIERRDEIQEKIEKDLVELQNSVNDLMSASVPAMKSVVEALGKIIPLLSGFIAKLVPIMNDPLGSFKGIGTSIANSVGTAVSKAFDSIKETFNGVKDTLGFYFSDFGAMIHNAMPWNRTKIERVSELDYKAGKREMREIAKSEEEIKNDKLTIDSFSSKEATVVDEKKDDE